MRALTNPNSPVKNGAIGEYHFRGVISEASPVLTPHPTFSAAVTSCGDKFPTPPFFHFVAIPEE